MRQISKSCRQEMYIIVTVSKSSRGRILDSSFESSRLLPIPKCESWPKVDQNSSRFRKIIKKNTILGTHSRGVAKPLGKALDSLAVIGFYKSGVSEQNLGFRGRISTFSVRIRSESHFYRNQLQLGNQELFPEVLQRPSSGYPESQIFRNLTNFWVNFSLFEQLFRPRILDARFLISKDWRYRIIILIWNLIDTSSFIKYCRR